MTFDMPILVAPITGPTTFNLSGVTRRWRVPDEIDRIMDVVGNVFRVGREDLIGRRKQGNLAWARQVAMNMAYDTNAYSLHDVGDRFQRDHGTVIHALRKVRERCENEKRCQQQVNLVKEMLRK